MRAAAECRDRVPCSDGALRDELGSITAEPCDHAIHQWIVGGAINLGDREPALDSGKRADLPIGEMAGEDDPSPGGDCPIDIFETADLNAAARFEDIDLPQMRVFGHDAAEIVPHAGDHARDLVIRKLGKGAAEVSASPVRDPKTGTDMTGERAAESRGAIERQ